MVEAVTYLVGKRVRYFVVDLTIWLVVEVP